MNNKIRGIGKKPLHVYLVILYEKDETSVLSVCISRAMADRMRFKYARKLRKLGDDYLNNYNNYISVLKFTVKGAQVLGGCILNRYLG